MTDDELYRCDVVRSVVWLKVAESELEVTHLKLECVSCMAFSASYVLV